jgi:hypothetical protein
MSDIEIFPEPAIELETIAFALTIFLTSTLPRITVSLKIEWGID